MILSERALVQFPEHLRGVAVYARFVTRKTWHSYCAAKGTVDLPAGLEYQLRLAPQYYTPLEAASHLMGIDLSPFSEILVPLYVPWKDLSDSAMNGNYMDPLFRQAELQLASAWHFRGCVRIQDRPWDVDLDAPEESEADGGCEAEEEAPESDA